MGNFFFLQPCRLPLALPVAESATETAGKAKQTRSFAVHHEAEYRTLGLELTDSVLITDALALLLSLVLALLPPISGHLHVLFPLPEMQFPLLFA